MGTLGGSKPVSEAVANDIHDKKAEAKINITSDFLKTIVGTILTILGLCDDIVIWADEIKNNYVS